MWNGYGWNVKAKIQEAPVNGKIYGRKDADWAEVVSDVTKAYVDAEIAKQVPRAGGTMTGHLVLPTGPGATNAVRKDYVDAADALKLNLTGGTLTGHLTLPATPAAANAVRKDYVDTADALKVAKGGDTMTGTLAISHGGGIFLRQRTPTHSVFLYTDSGTSYFLLTDSGNPDGSYNGLRPFAINLASGNVNLAHRLDVGGHAYSAAGRLLGTNDGAFGNYLPLGGGTMTGRYYPANSTGAIEWNQMSHGIEVRSDGGNLSAAYMAFHRQNYYAVQFGLDHDNQFAWGGWSAGGVRYKFWTEANFTPSSYVNSWIKSYIQ